MRQKRLLATISEYQVGKMSCLTLSRGTEAKNFEKSRFLPQQVLGERERDTENERERQRETETTERKFRTHIVGVVDNIDVVGVVGCSLACCKCSRFYLTLALKKTASLFNCPS